MNPESAHCPSDRKVVDIVSKKTQEDSKNGNEDKNENETSYDVAIGEVKPVPISITVVEKKPSGYRIASESTKLCSRCGMTKKLVTDKPKKRHCDVGGKCVIRKIRQMLIKAMSRCPRIRELTAKQDTPLTEDTFAAICHYFFVDEVCVEDGGGSFDLE